MSERYIHSDIVKIRTGIIKAAGKVSAVYVLGSEKEVLFFSMTWTMLL